MTGWRDHQPVKDSQYACQRYLLRQPASRAVLGGSGAQGFAAQERALADESEVVVAARGVGDRRPAAGRDTQVGQVPDIPTIDTNRPNGVSDADGIAGVAAAVDVGDRDRTAAGRRRGDPAVTGGGDVGRTLVAPTEESGAEALGRHTPHNHEAFRGS